LRDVVDFVISHKDVARGASTTTGTILLAFKTKAILVERLGKGWGRCWAGFIATKDHGV
jgi:hypothetical protein